MSVLFPWLLYQCLIIILIILIKGIYIALSVTQSALQVNYTHKWYRETWVAHPSIPNPLKHTHAHREMTQLVSQIGALRQICWHKMIFSCLAAQALTRSNNLQITIVTLTDAPYIYPHLLIFDSSFHRLPFSCYHFQHLGQCDLYCTADTTWGQHPGTMGGGVVGGGGGVYTTPPTITSKIIN